MNEIAQATFNFQLFNEIMPTIYQRFTEKEANQWRQIYKALVLLEFLVKNGSERVIDDARSHLSLIKVLRNFYYTDEQGKDQGINVRNRSKELAELLADLDKVRTERRKAKMNKNKYTGGGNDGGGGPSFMSNTGSRYGGFGSDSLGKYSLSFRVARAVLSNLTLQLTGSGGGGGGSGRDEGARSFQDSAPRAAEFEEYDAGDWDESDSRSAPAPRRSDSSTSHRTKPVPSTPKAALVKVKEVNLFDFDDDEQAPAPVATRSNVLSNIASNVMEDEFDDFQSAPVVPRAALPAAQTQSRPMNAFELLNAPSPASSSISYNSPSMTMSAIQPVRSSSTLAPSPAPSIVAAAPKPASDFSDLFAFGPSPTTTAKPTGPSKSMAEIAQQARQSSLFGAAPASASAGNVKSNNGGWDSLI